MACRFREGRPECSGCRYVLTGLPEQGRCPECGTCYDQLSWVDGPLCSCERCTDRIWGVLRWTPLGWLLLASGVVGRGGSPGMAGLMIVRTVSTVLAIVFLLTLLLRS